ncbi:uncharacterized protein LOC132037674 [Lycium ferocissimum]|uniref:uncharacterized protein LOC132037674 n=1 Tax=Lycium ferocissimum TaxID=112874 RepID=UPI002815C8E5|nr:uncharacterized protein LOC132037674 [Lycium ferocissimum]XP_059284206.1 uncharacterized protein LOC132037674 [Lycium ferocissimum]XP_059284207.1 uncharacterized protein LOC132037674 [Lycium ferocissimum]
MSMNYIVKSSLIFPARQNTLNLCFCYLFNQVAGVAVIFEVQRSSRSEARKEEVRKQELEAMKQRDEELSREIEFLKNRISELEKHAKTRGLSSMFSIGHAEGTQDKVKAG